MPVVSRLAERVFVPMARLRVPPAAAFALNISFRVESSSIVRVNVRHESSDAF
jgi:hypothetical protein